MAPKTKKRAKAAHASAIYTPGELARVLGISRNGVYSALRKGTIPTFELGAAL